MKKLQDTEYMYGSTRIRALENRIPTGEKLAAMCDAKSAADVMARLAECGIAPADDREHDKSPEAVSLAREAMFTSLLRQAFRDVEEAAPDAAVFAWLRYPYDCNNIKMALKCQARRIGADETVGMMFDFGTVPAQTVMDAVRDGKYDALPTCFSDATAKAYAAYNETGDPRQIDAILDRACFIGMKNAAEAAGEPVLIRWMQAKADMLNAVITLRILRMKRGAMGRLFLEETLLPGGALPQDFFLSAYEEGEDKLWTAIGAAGLPAYCGQFVKRAEKTERTPAAVEKALDDTWMALIRADAKIPFGAPVMAGYILGWETAVKNMRIVLASRDAGLDARTSRERVRENYV